MLNLFITFDYELYLGENYQPSENVLFAPTDKLLDAMNKRGITSTFFADICSVFQHRKYGLNDYCDRFSSQIKDMIKGGHDVQLHLHPNWLVSEYKDSKWDINIDHYKLQSFGFGNHENSVENIVANGKNYLESELKTVKDDYRCIAYRAGGYCLQPEVETLKVLQDNGIVIDSSVALHQYGDNGINDFDYRKVPKSLSWWISKDRDVLDDSSSSGDMYEIPVGGVSNNITKYIGLSGTDIKLEGPKGMGRGIALPVKKKPNRIKKALIELRRWTVDYGILSLDQRGAGLLERDIKEIYRRYHCDKKEGYVAIICHPKLIDEVSLKSFERFVDIVLKSPDKYRFMNMSQMTEIIGK